MHTKIKSLCLFAMLLPAVSLAAESKTLQVDSAKKMDNDRLHESAKGYDRIQAECETKSFHIRTQYYEIPTQYRGSDLRYFAWKKGEPLSNKPQLELKSGTYEHQSGGGSYDLIFKNGAYTYKLSFVAICSTAAPIDGSDDCGFHLVVSKGDKVLSNEVCHES